MKKQKEIIAKSKPKVPYNPLHPKKDIPNTEIEGWDFSNNKKQLVADPKKNDLMHKFIDKYAEMMNEKSGADSCSKQSALKPHQDKGKQGPTEENKKQTYSGHEEGKGVLEAIHASQTKQRQQKLTNYIIDDPIEISPENDNTEEISNSEYSKSREKYSQSVIIPVQNPVSEVYIGRKPGLDPGMSGSRKTAHRRMESRSFDVSSIKKIMSIDLASVDPKVLSKKEIKKK